jgi:hypothetical protein
VIPRRNRIGLAAGPPARPPLTFNPGRVVGSARAFGSPPGPPGEEFFENPR